MLNATKEFVQNIIGNALCKKKKKILNIIKNIGRDNSVFPKPCPCGPNANLRPCTHHDMNGWYLKGLNAGKMLIG